MEALHFRVRTKAPVIISTIGGDTSLTPTHDYLPGTSILGAFVSRYVLLTKQRGADTAALHLDDTFFQMVPKRQPVFWQCLFGGAGRV